MRAARENVHLLTRLYRRAYALPAPLHHAAERFLDGLFLGDALPAAARLRILGWLLAREEGLGPVEFLPY